MCSAETKRKVYILAYSNKGWVSRLIRWQTRSRYSHVALRFGDTVIESVEPEGVRQRDVESADSAADVFSLELSEERYAKLLYWCLARVGDRYDWPAIFRFVSRRKWCRDDCWFCSEFVYTALENVGYPLLARTEPWEVSPGLLVRSPLLFAESTT